MTRKRRNLHVTPEIQTVMEAFVLPKMARQRCISAVPQRRGYHDGKLYKLFETACDGLKMTGMKCPHRGTDLTNCPVVEGVVTCPAHGMRWRVEDGSLVKNGEKQAGEICINRNG